ncbi:hypothetical protein GMB86_01910 [Terrilactibacillus sp. BCM23-1]|uniref:Uncharacterized protein n=1 Tax=Terrilactibacillus tamarindi TaxID=2599694 RepID=A0A6N8CLH5_9BACI|nr:hypothetical protein [Terrilactibacillus tamarindi]MTT30769.1 hypothetical protein [Terrilactibacillus tamarindi]
MKTQSNQESDSRKKGFQFVTYIFLAKLLICIILGGILVLVAIMIQRSLHVNKDTLMTSITSSGYLNDGKTLVLLSKNGTYQYSSGKWHRKKTHHDHPFVVTSQGYYELAEGHLLTKNSKGEITNNVSLPDESIDLMAAGYDTKRVYLMNNKSTLFYTDGHNEDWKSVQPNGLKGKIKQLAIAPENRNKLVILTSDGIYFSQNKGKQFNKIVNNKHITSLTYGKNDEVIAASKEGKSTLLRTNTQSRLQVPVDLSTVKEDIITHIIQNPKNEKEIVVVTKGNDIFKTDNYGTNWIILAKKGQGLNGGK